MTLPTFNPPIPPSFGGTLSPKLSVLEAKFGDGYSQRAPDGINNSQLGEISLSWDFLSQAEASAIEGFFYSMEGYKAFLWTPPARSTPEKFICRKWSRTRVRFPVDKISATFEKVNDL